MAIAFSIRLQNLRFHGGDAVTNVPFGKPKKHRIRAYAMCRIPRTIFVAQSRRRILYCRLLDIVLEQAVILGWRALETPTDFQGTSARRDLTFQPKTFSVQWCVF